MSSYLQSVLPGTDEPDVSYNFIVLIGIRPFGDFRSVTGAGISLAPQNIVEGGRNHSPHILPYGSGQVMKWGEVTLRWGTPVWNTLYSWADAVRVGKFFRRDVFVVQLKRNGWPTRLMRFAGAWPIRWKASPLDTASSEWALSELTLVYEDFNMILTRTSSLDDLINQIQDAGTLVGNAAGELIDAAADAYDAASDFVEDPEAALEAFGESIYDGLAEGWEAEEDAAEDVWEGAGDLADAVEALFEERLEDNGEDAEDAEDGADDDDEDGSDAPPDAPVEDFDDDEETEMPPDPEDLDAGS